MGNRNWIFFLVLISCSGVLERSISDYLPYRGDRRWFFTSGDRVELWEPGKDTVFEDDYYRTLIRNGSPWLYKIEGNNVFFLCEDTIVNNGELYIYNRDLLPLWPSVFVDGFTWEYEREDSVFILDRRAERRISIEGKTERIGERYKVNLKMVKVLDTLVDTLNYIYIFAPDTGVIIFNEGEEFSLYRYDY